MVPAEFQNIVLWSVVGKWCFLLPLGVFVVHVPFVASKFRGSWFTSAWGFQDIGELNSSGSTPTPQRRCLFRDLQKKMTPDVVCYLDRSAVTLKVPKFLLESDVRFYCSHMVILFQINLRLECSTGANILSLWGVMPVCLKCGEFPRRLFVA